MARAIDQTLLKPEATPDHIDALCDQALQYGFGGVCVNPVHVRRAATRLGGPRSVPRSPDEGSWRPTLGARRIPEGTASATVAPVVVSVAGFPLGAGVTATKVDEARRAVDDGATEIDMVADLGALIAGDGTRVRKDIEAVAGAVHERLDQGLVKVILETAVLTCDQIILGCRCCAEGGADFVKTSTGFHPAGGATVEVVRLLHRVASPIRVKASGGIRTAATAVAMLEAGAARLGTSSGPAILEAFRRGEA